MAKSLVPITVMASDICEEIGDNTLKYKMRIMKYIAAKYKFMTLYLTHNVNIQTIELDCDCGTIHELPKCFVYETKVGIMSPDTGRIANLWLDNRMAATKFDDTTMEEEVRKVWTGEQSSAPINYYNYGPDGDVLIGYGTGFHRGGRYSIDREKGILYTSTALTGKLVVEFKSDGISEGLKLVPSELTGALRYGAKAMFYEDSNPRQSAFNDAKWMDEYATIKRLYNHKPINVLAQLFQASLNG